MTAGRPRLSPDEAGVAAVVARCAMPRSLSSRAGPSKRWGSRSGPLGSGHRFGHAARGASADGTTGKRGSSLIVKAIASAATCGIGGLRRTSAGVWLVAAAIAVTIAVRLIPLYLPAADAYAWGAVRAAARAEVLRNDPSAAALDPTSLDAAVAEWSARHADALAPVKRQAEQRFLDAYTFRGEDGRRHVYLGDEDGYYWLQLARTLLARGSVCDRIEGGACIDALTNAPVGQAIEYVRSPHVYAIAALERLIGWLRPGFPLSSAGVLVPMLLSALMMIPAFLIAQSVSNRFGGLMAVLLLSLNSVILARTGDGDDDIWTVALPILSTALITASFSRRGWRGRLLLSGLGGATLALLVNAWKGWPLFVLATLAGLVALAAWALLSTVIARVRGEPRNYTLLGRGLAAGGRNRPQARHRRAHRPVLARARGARPGRHRADAGRLPHGGGAHRGRREDPATVDRSGGDRSRPARISAGALESARTPRVGHAGAPAVEPGPGGAPRRARQLETADGGHPRSPGPGRGARQLARRQSPLRPRRCDRDHRPRVARCRSLDELRGREIRTSGGRTARARGRGRTRACGLSRRRAPSPPGALRPVRGRAGCRRARRGGAGTGRYRRRGDGARAHAHHHGRLDGGVRRHPGAIRFRCRARHLVGLRSLGQVLHAAQGRARRRLAAEPSGLLDGARTRRDQRQ